MLEGSEKGHGAHKVKNQNFLRQQSPARNLTFDLSAESFQIFSCHLRLWVFIAERRA